MDNAKQNAPDRVTDKKSKAIIFSNAKIKEREKSH